MRKVLFAFLPALALLLAPPFAGAKSVRVSGKLPQGKGMTLVAQTPAGASKSAELRRDSFRLKLRGVPRTRLQLIGADGAYFGPVILGEADKRRAYGALSGKKSVRLGKLQRGNGFYAAKRVPRKAVSERRKDLVKLTKRGAPTGAGRLGFRPRKTKRSAMRLPAASAQVSQSGVCEPGADADQDGLPNSLDADASGNGLLNIVDWDNASYTQWCPTNTFAMTWANRHGAANLNSGMSEAEIDAFVRDNLQASFELSREALPGRQIERVNVVCVLFPWCQTATVNTGTGDEWSPPEEPLWSSFDFELVSNRDVSGDPGWSPDDPDWFSTGIRMRSTPSQIGPADAVIYMAQTTDGPPVAFADIFGPYLVTTPAIFRIETAKGTVHEISYPLEPGEPGAGGYVDEEGNHHAPTPIELDDTTAIFSVYRPQRRTIPGVESGEWRDIGGLRYLVHNPSGDGGSSEGGNWSDGYCAKSTYSNLSPTLRQDGVMLEDTAPDSVPDPANSFEFTLDMAACAGGRENLPPPDEPGFIGLRVETAPGANASSGPLLTFADE